MKKILLATLWGVATAGGAQSPSPSGEALPLVAITQIVDHPSLNAIRQGVQDEIKAAGLAVRYEVESAQGQPAIAQQIAEKFVGLKPAVIVAIATPSAQAVANVAEGKIPLVFGSITDPVAAKLVPDLHTPVKNLTGTTDSIPLAEQLAVLREALPSLKRLGTVYNPGDANAAASVAKLKTVAAGANIELVEAPATKSSEVAEATAALAGRADAIFLVLDNTAVSALEALLQAAEEQKLPVFSADVDSVKRGTVLSLGFDYYDVGRSTGAQVVKILRGTAPEAIPVQTVEKFRLVVNPAAAKRFGLELPPALIQKAAEVIEEKKP